MLSHFVCGWVHLGWCDAVSDDLLGEEEPGSGRFHTCSSVHLVRAKEKNYTSFSFSFGPAYVRTDSQDETDAFCIITGL